MQPRSQGVRLTAVVGSVALLALVLHQAHLHFAGTFVVPVPGDSGRSSGLPADAESAPTPAATATPRPADRIHRHDAPPSRGATDAASVDGCPGSPLCALVDGEAAVDRAVLAGGAKGKPSPPDDGASLLQIHHGIYRVIGAVSGVKFAFKTECRPASRWHGQQGWTEVAAHWFARFLFGPIGLATVPFARGAIVAVSQRQLTATVHRDRCGELQESNSGGAAGVAAPRLIGVALEWAASHDDGAMPDRGQFERYFRGPRLAPAPPRGSSDREELAQISDVFLIDYLLGNEDREIKNWFRNASRHRVAMDNGWCFSGRGYAESVCAPYASLLKCPPLLRGWAGGASDCRGLLNCRFRRESVERVKTALATSSSDERWGAAGEGPAAAAWARVLARDPLFSWLGATYGFAVEHGRKGAGPWYSTALARHVTGCAGATASGMTTRPFDAAAAAAVAVAAGLRPRDGAVVGTADAAVVWAALLARGIGGRLAAFDASVQACIRDHGEENVLL